MSDFASAVSKGLLFSLLVMLLLSAAVGAVGVFVDISDAAVGLLGVAILGAAAYSAGMFSTRLKRSMGLLQGFVCGAVLFLSAMILSIAFSEFSFSEMASIKAAVSVICGIIGGVRGVNVKLTGKSH